MTDVVWTPDPSRTSSTLLARFMENTIGSGTYDELWRWSTTDREDFWRHVWDFCGVIGDKGDVVLADDAMPGARWFPEARLNFAENLLAGDDRTAVIAVDESGARMPVSLEELRSLVGAVQVTLQGWGVESGDRVAGILPNGLEAVVAMLATASIGAVWSSCSPDFGPTGIVDRFGQIRPKVIFASDGYTYNGRPYDVTATVVAAAQQIDGLERVVWVPRIGVTDLPALPSSTWAEATAQPRKPDFVAHPFDHPLYIMFSSGTTGPPKSIVHGAGGTLLKHLSEHQLHCDIRPGDTVFWFTTCGWMMWNWLVSALASRATLVLYDGSPGHPDLGTLWRLAATEGITHFGTSPKFLGACAKAEIIPGDLADLSPMRWLGSTGAPLNPDQFDWVAAHLPGVQIASVSGGTDIIGCFAAGVPTLPVIRGQLQARVLGMAVEAWDETGRSVVGERGELVCTASFPSMPIRFWNDPDGSRYRSAYFDAFPGVWTHGDYIEITADGGVIVYGRSDTTLNPGGVRIGTAEIYRAIEPMTEIVDSLVVGVPRDGDVEVVLFVVPGPGVALDDDLRTALVERIRHETSPRHVPRRIHEVPEIPYTISGKKVEKAVRQLLTGEPVRNRDALANPDALDAFLEYAQL